MTNETALQIAINCNVIKGSTQIPFRLRRILNDNASVRAQIIDKYNAIINLGKESTHSQEEVSEEASNFFKEEFIGSFSIIPLGMVEDLKVETIKFSMGFNKDKPENMTVELTATLEYLEKEGIIK